MFLIITDQSVTIKTLQSNIKYLYNTRVDSQLHYNTKLIIQCHRCQQWGHTTANYRASPRCLKCAQGHWTRDCTTFLERLETNLPNLKCANCNQNYPANSTECKEYLRKIEFIQNKRQQNTKIYKKQEAIQKFIPAQIPTNNPSAKGNPFTATRDPVPATQLPNPHSKQTLSFNELVSEIDELNLLIDINKMLNAVKQLNQILKSCNSELQKFKAFFDFFL